MSSESCGHGTTLGRARGRIAPGRAWTEGRQTWGYVGDRFCGVQVCVNRCDDDTSFHGEQVDTRNRYAYPGVDDHPFVEDVVQHIDDARARRPSLQLGHVNQAGQNTVSPVTCAYGPSACVELLSYDVRWFERTSCNLSNVDTNNFILHSSRSTVHRSLLFLVTLHGQRTLSYGRATRVGHVRVISQAPPGPYSHSPDVFPVRDGPSELREAAKEPR